MSGQGIDSGQNYVQYLPENYRRKAKEGIASVAQSITQPEVKKSPAVEVFNDLMATGKWNLYPHKGPKYMQPISGDVACYTVAANLQNALGEKLGHKQEFFPSEENLVFTNVVQNPKYIASTLIPPLVQKAKLPIGTAFWIKGRLDIKDPKSLNKEAKNHWFVLVGFRTEKNGTRTPLFVDQGSNNQRAPRPIDQILGTTDRYLHKVFVPDYFRDPAAHSPARMQMLV